MRGKHPIPTELLKANGSYRADRHGKRGDLDTAPAVPDRPDHLGEVASAEWTRVAALLGSARVLTHGDRAVLAAYCSSYGRWVEAEQKLATEGCIVTSPNGYQQPSPWLSISRNAHDRMVKTACELGLTPSSRTRVHPVPKTSQGIESRNRDLVEKYFKDC